MSDSRGTTQAGPEQMQGTGTRFGFPEKVLTAFLCGSIALWTVQCSLLQNVLSIDIYEAIIWGQQAQWGYAKHPPLSGWLGYAFSWAAGHRDWGIYFAAQLCIGIGVFFAYLLARQFFDRYKAAAAALLPYFLFYLTPSETKFSTYFVEMALAPAASYFLLRALRENRVWQWLTLGALCGLGMLNKYSFGLTMLGFALIVLSSREYRRRLASPGPYLAGIVLVLIFLPHLVWLVRHNFVCLRHVAYRLEDTHSPLMPLIVLATGLYPLVSGALVMLIALFPGFRREEDSAGLWENYRKLAGWEHEPRNFEAARFGLILTLTPGLAYFLLSLTGQDIILMWLCPTGFWSGIAILALCPVRADRKLFARIAILLGIFIAGMFAATTADLLINTRTSLHLDRDEVIRQALAVWRKQRGDEKIPLAVGNFRAVGIINHYLPYHPPACEPDNDTMIDLYRETLRSSGALLIDKSETELRKFTSRLNTPVKLEKCTLYYKAPCGRKRRWTFHVGVLPPGTEVK